MKKKALIVVNLAGFLTFLWKDIEILQSMGYSVEVAMNAKMADGSDAVEVPVLKKMGIPAHHVDFDTKSPVSKDNLTAFSQLRKLLKNDYALIHCHTPIVGLLTRVAAIPYRRKGAKVLYTTHGFTFTDRSSRKSWLVYRNMEDFASHFCDAIITINHEDYHNACQMHAPKTYLIPSVGLDNSRFRNVSVDRDAYRARFGVGCEDYLVLAVGELSDRKNQQMIIRALSLLPDKERYVFVVFGRAVTDSPIPGKMESLAKELGVRLVLAGHRADIPEANACADVAVIPSVREGLGMAGLEALASGVSVVGSDVQGIREYVVNGKTGYLCDPESPQEFADAIAKVCRYTPEEKARAAKDCRAMAQEFDSTKSYQAVAAIYKELLKE